MIRSIIGAVDCSNQTISVVAELGFPRVHDKAVAQMSFVSQLPLAFRPYELRGLRNPSNQNPEEPDLYARGKRPSAADEKQGLDLRAGKWL